MNKKSTLRNKIVYVITIVFIGTMFMYIAIFIKFWQNKSKNMEFKCLGKNCIDLERLNLRVNMLYMESIYTVRTLDIPSNAVDKIDVSVKQDGSIMMWYLDSDNNNMYEIYIGSLKDIVITDFVTTFKIFPYLKVLDLSLFDFTKMTEIPNDLFGNCNTVIDSCSLKDISTIIVKNEENKKLVKELLKENNKFEVQVLVSGDVNEE